MEFRHIVAVKDRGPLRKRNTQFKGANGGFHAHLLGVRAILPDASWLALCPRPRHALALAGVDRLQCDAFGLEDEITNKAYQIEANHKGPNPPGLFAIQLLHQLMHWVAAVSRETATALIALQNGVRKAQS